jgi:hypothetical protein
MISSFVKDSLLKRVKECEFFNHDNQQITKKKLTNNINNIVHEQV